MPLHPEPVTHIYPVLEGGPTDSRTKIRGDEGVRTPVLNTSQHNRITINLLALYLNCKGIYPERGLDYDKTMPFNP